MSIKIHKKSLMALILVLILLSGNTIILAYVTPLLYIVGLFSVLWFEPKKLKANRYTKRIMFLYFIWVIFLIINTLQSYDINASKNILPIFIIGGLFGFFSWRESTAQAYIKIIRVICLFFAFSILEA